MAKKIMAFLPVLGLLAFSACTHQTGAGVAVTPAPVLEKIVQKGELIVGTSANQPPLNATTKEGEIIGFDVDLSRQMADAMGVRLRLAAMPFSELLPALEAGEIDMIVSGMTITPERNFRVAFAGPYLISGKGILTKKKTLRTLKDASQMDSPDRTLAALKGSTSQGFVEEALPRARLIPTEDYDQAVSMVIQEKVDAFIADYPICVLSVLRYPGKELAALVAPSSYEPLGIALPPNDPLLVNWVNNFLGMLEGRGELDRLKKRWFEKTSWLKRLR
jgi:polar amino acid transport system substrate-binding protein